LLQLSDLFVVPETAGQLAGELENVISKQQEIRKVDCIVLCGNLVGNPTGFDSLPRVIRALEACLPNPTDAFENHIFLTPGKTDVTDSNGKLNFEPFKKFYDSFFENILSEDIPVFDPKKPILRRCRNLNWIGALWWSGKEHDSIDLPGANELANAVNEVNFAIGKLPYEYPRFRPSILVSAETPLLDMAERERPWPLELRQKLKDVDLHLFGAGPVTSMNAEPFTVEYRSLGTGPRHKNSIWPLSMNLLELYPTYQADRVSRTIVSARSYVKRAESALWDEDLFLPDKPSHTDTPESFVHGAFARSVNEEMFEENRTILPITGLNGIWQEELMRALYDSQRVGNTVCDIVRSSPVTTYRDNRDFVRKALAVAGKSTQSGAIPKIVLIHDLAFSASEEESERLEKLKELLKDLQQAGGQNLKFLYFVNLFDHQIDGAGIDQMFLPPVDEDSLNQLLKDYERWIPLRQDDIRLVTQGYYDFSYGLLKYLKAHFEEWPGARPLGFDSPWVLLESTLQNSESLRRAGDQFVKDARRIHGGGAVCTFIRGIIQRQTQEVGLKSAMRAAVNFSANEIKDEDTDPREIQRALDRFTQFHVLRRQAGRYSLREKVPFFLEAYKMEGSIQNWAANGQVFLSYAKEDRTIATEQRQWISDQGIAVWWDARIDQPNYRDLIKERLRSSKAVVVLWSVNSVGNDWVKWEATRANESGKLINVLVDITPDQLPAPFDQTIRLVRTERERILRTIKNLFERPQQKGAGAP
jgi:hypothetical protein